MVSTGFIYAPYVPAAEPRVGDFVCVLRGHLEGFVGVVVSHDGGYEDYLIRFEIDLTRFGIQGNVVWYLPSSLQRLSLLEVLAKVAADD